MKKKKVICIIILIALSLSVYEVVKIRSDTLSFHEVKTDFYAFPLNFNNIESKGLNYKKTYQYLTQQQTLSFTIEGIHVKIQKEKQPLKIHHKKRKNEDVTSTQVYHNEKLIRILYASKVENDGTDIFTKFSYNYQGYFIKGSIRSVYRENKKLRVTDMPDEVYEETQQRILDFVDTYFI